MAAISTYQTMLRLTEAQRAWVDRHGGPSAAIKALIDREIAKEKA